MSHAERCPECKRLRHIVDVLMYAIKQAGHTAENVDANTRVENGRLETWFLGEWVDVENARAEMPESMLEAEE